MESSELMAGTPAGIFFSSGRTKVSHFRSTATNSL
jgi:hypothetical protein